MSQNSALPRPGPRWGTYPQRMQRGAARQARAASALGWAGAISPWLPPSGLLQVHTRWLRDVDQRVARHQDTVPGSAAWEQALSDTKAALRRDGFSPETLATALALLVSAIQHTVGARLYPQQVLAAALMLDQRLVEMATGEGKTLTMAAAAAVAALAGVPTHVITANDYLAERDATDLAPLWQVLKLQVGHIGSTHDAEQKRPIYGSDIVYSTAKEIAFDYLRDQLLPMAPGGASPMLRGLSLALLDEADSILLDEAVVPLIISSARQEHPHQQAQRRAVWWQAWSLAGQLDASTHIRIDAAAARAALTTAGETRLGELTQTMRGVWQRPRLRQELVSLALTARHALVKDVHYLLRDGRVELLDQLTGRIAQGRILSQGLHTLIEMKEGLQPSPPADTLAQITFQRFFQRYWRLGGISGTLHESRKELTQVYGLAVVRMPTRLPSRLTTLALRHFKSPQARWHAVAERVASLQGQGRPVLIGTDSVNDSEALSALLTERGVSHIVLNARHDAHEAVIVSRAGHAGAVTVATRMAGRGTDITLSEAALRAGGLHVISCQRNESRRMDRQLRGRCARQGQPGSAEAWICTVISQERAGTAHPKLQRCNSGVIPSSPWLSARWHQCLARVAQWLQEQRQIGIRRHLLDRDQQWEAQHQSVRQSGN
jgi:preprotein translocase subunit SecA